MKAKIKIIIADDHPIFRRGLCSVIEADSGLELVGEAENGEIALKLIEIHKPEIVILDVNMPVMDGIAAARIIHQDYPEIKTIFLTLEKDREILTALKTLKVKGYLLKDSAVMEIVNCIKIVAAGRIFIDPDASELLMQSFVDDSFDLDKNALLSRLTPTETRILRLIAESKTSREISEEMYISVRTAENHRFNICSKLNLKGNHSLLKFALENRDLILSKDANE